MDENGGYDQRLRELGLANMNEFTRRVEELTLAGAEEEHEANVDLPWRDLA